MKKGGSSRRHISPLWETVVPATKRMRDVEKQRCIHSSFASGMVASSTCVSPHASHSKVYRSGSPPNRSVFRMSRIDRAQPMHRGRFNAILSERSLNTETSGSPIGFQQETRTESDMRLRHYRHVARGLIVGNEVRVSRTTEVNGSFLPSRFWERSNGRVAPLGDAGGVACKTAIGDNSSATPGDPPACSAVRSPCSSHIGHFRRLSR